MVRHDETIIKWNYGLVRVRAVIIKEQKYTVSHESLSIATQVYLSDLSEKLETRFLTKSFLST